MQSSIPKWRVLVFPGGTEIGLEIGRSLEACKEVDLFSAGVSSASHATYAFREHFEMPKVNETGWLERLTEIVVNNAITHIFPAHDDAIIALVEYAHKIPAKIVTSPEKTCRIARSKMDTLATLRNFIPTPEFHSTPEEVEEYPVFVKPNKGQGSRGATIIPNRISLDVALERDSSLIVLEYLPGREFTVDCFSDREKGVLYARGRTRARITSGISSNSTFVENSRFMDLAKRIQDVLSFHGGWFFQVKENTVGELCLLEVAARIPGTSSLSRVCGVNLPLLSLYEAERIPVTIQPLDLPVTVDRTLTPIFKHGLIYDTLYVDLDDTLIIHNRVNAQLVTIIYQCLNRGVRVILLTRHGKDVKATLDKFRLTVLFDEIVHLTNGESKANYIKSSKAVFIDDSFSEVSAVGRIMGVTAIHTSAADLLLEDYI